MKILVANKFYYSRGGDCIYTIELESLLKKNGHEVAIFAMNHPNNIETSYSEYFPSAVSLIGIKNKIKFLLRPFGTKEVKIKFETLMDTFKPDIVHLNNIHSQLSPVLAEIANKKGVKVIWTLHDYKLLCPRYDCLRNGSETCELCFYNKKAVLKYRCMKNSLIASIIAYAEAKKWNRNRIEKYTHIFICPSSFMKNKMQQGGFKENKLYTLSNFINSEKIKSDLLIKENYYCYLGRLSHEKGVKILIDVAKTLPYKLKIIGSGPLSEELEKQAINYKNIEFLGHKNWTEIQDIIGKAAFMVAPSEWYENNPISIIESLCLGTPVLGANIGGIPELINNENGLLFESSNKIDLSHNIKKMFQIKFDYTRLAKESLEKYSSEEYYVHLLRIYNNLKNE